METLRLIINIALIAIFSWVAVKTLIKITKPQSKFIKDKESVPLKLLKQLIETPMTHREVVKFVSGKGSGKKYIEILRNHEIGIIKFKCDSKYRIMGIPDSLGVCRNRQLVSQGNNKRQVKAVMTFNKYLTIR